MFIGHEASHLGPAQAVVFSRAVSGDNPELEAARSGGLPLIHRGRMLAMLMDFRKGISICGTHGKTTTTALISLLLRDAGLDPTVVIGARLQTMGSNARLGQGEWMVAEADESDRSFLELSPDWVVITNIDLDHMDEYRDLDDLGQAFLQHMNSVPAQGQVIACADDPRLSALLKKVHRPVITYGLNPGADFRAQKADLSWVKSSFDCWERDQLLGRIELPLPGRHNLLNSLAAVAVGQTLKVSFSVIQQSLAAFQGAERRLQWKGEKEGVWVIDDYGHHPAEVRATLEACGQAGRRLVVVFQPHRYSRTQHLMGEWGSCFAEADQLYLMDIYPAGEPPIPGVTSEALARRISRHREVTYLGSRRELLESLREKTQPGDLLLTLGAGNVWEIGEAFLEQGN
ncbi:MAG: UDP-N-acetylmuramate--L-alanine ligase, partial [Acidobacteriota bacterium]